MNGVHLAAIPAAVCAVLYGLLWLGGRLAARRTRRDWTVSDGTLRRLEKLRQDET